MNISSNRPNAQPQQMGGQSPIQVIAPYIPAATEPAHQQYRDVLLTNVKEASDFHQIATFYSSANNIQLAAAMTDMFSLKAADWIIKMNIAVDQTVAGSIEANMQIYAEVRNNYNRQVAAINQPQTVVPQVQTVGRNQQLGVNGVNQIQHRTLGANNTFTNTASSATNKLGGSSSAHAKVATVAPTIVQPTAVSSVVPTTLVVSTPQYDTLREYLLYNKITDYQDLIEGYMDKQNHDKINDLLATELGESTTVVSRRIEAVSAKITSKQMDVSPVDQAVIIDTSENPSSSMTPRSLYTALAVSKHISNSNNSTKPRIITGCSVERVFADTPDVIRTSIIAQITDGSLQTVADKILNMYSTHIEQAHNDYGNANTLLTLNDKLTDFVNEYIKHRWGGVITIDSFMEDYNSATTMLTAEYGIPRNVVNSMCRSYRSSVRGIETDDMMMVMWAEYYTGILLNRTVTDLGWECMTDVPLGVNDLLYNNLISMVKKADAVNRFVYVYVESHCFKTLVTKENRMSVAKIY